MNIELINENIPITGDILLVQEKDNKKITKIISFSDALLEAKKEKLDLLCVSLNSTPPVCKLVNYSKYLFEKKKKEKKKTKKVINKELRFRFSIGDADLKRKIDKAIVWVKEGCIVKFNMLIGRKNSREKAYEKCLILVENIKSFSVSPVELRNNKIETYKRNYCFYIYKK